MVLIDVTSSSSTPVMPATLSFTNCARCSWALMSLANLIILQTAPSCPYTGLQDACSQMALPFAPTRATSPEAIWPAPRCSQNAH